MAEANYSLKDQLFNRDTVSIVAECLAGVYAGFDQDKFVDEAVLAFTNLELKERMAYVADMIPKYITEDYLTTLKILDQSLALLKEGTEGFVFGAYQDYIMNMGCTPDYLDQSLIYMGKFTSYFSAEFAIRPFINTFPDQTLAMIKTWAVSDNHHQRRLASEGLRPKLPWAMGIDFDYKRAIPVLDHLFTDTERYVTRSVANHLNDISKFDPDLVIDTLGRWRTSNSQDQAEMDYMTSHALRTLVKQGNSRTLSLLGYPQNPKITIADASILTPKINLGDFLEFEFTIKAHEDLSLMIDYTVNYPMAKGKRSEKVFKIKKTSLKKGQSLTLTKKHQFKVMTTKKLYAGEYGLRLKINGSEFEVGTFELEVF